MATDTHFFQISFEYLLTKTVNGKEEETTDSATLLATPTLTEGVSIKVKKDEIITSSVQLVYTTFNRKVYQPNEIVADICFSNNDIQKNLKIFFNSKVSLIRYGNSAEAETFDGFYVYDALPLKKTSTNLYVRFHIYSLDHQLTIKKYSHTYVAKKLLSDILLLAKDEDTNVINTSNAQKFKFTIEVAPLMEKYTENGKEKSRIVLDRLYYEYKESDTECILPYLVQYNESFYDFMVRTANRCGEFFYWDAGKLRLGRSALEGDTFQDPGSTTSGYSCTVFYKNTNTHVKDEDPYQTIRYSLDDLNRSKDFIDGITSKSDIADKVDDDKVLSEKQYLCFGNDSGTLNPALSEDDYTYNNEVNQDVYRTRLYRDRFDSLHHRVVGNAAKYGTSIVSLLLNETTVYDFLKKFIVNNALMTSVAAAQWGQTDRLSNNHHMAGEKLYDDEEDRPNADEREVYKDKLLVYSNLFTSSDTKGHLTNEGYYNEIRQKEEMLSHQLVTFSTSLPQKLRLGQEITYNSNKYVIVQIKMKLGTNVSQFSGIDAAAEAEFQKMSNLMEVVAIPEDGSTVYPPLHPAGHVRRSEPQIAFVADAMDPQKRGRVRIKYPWQSSDDTEASPWIRVLTPSATPGTGCTFQLVKNDEVLVEYESNNIERPYVAGSLYNKNNHTPFERGDMALISKNGHGIAFDDPIDWSKFIAGISPTYKFINQFLAINTADNTDALKLTGGTTISDAYGFYKIAMSTDQRRIDIKSPFGTVNIDAFQGISICAPNGDINIKGQNVNIEAGNSIKITSGTNITKKRDWVKSDNNIWTTGKDLINIVGGAVIDYLGIVAQPIDLDLLRKVFQVFLRPIDGTLEIKSNQYLLLEAGKGEAMAQRDRYVTGKTPDSHNRPKKYTNSLVDANAELVGLHAVIHNINVFTDEVVRNIMIKQGDIQKKKDAFTALRTAAAGAPNNKVGGGCIQANDILQAVYNGNRKVDYNDRSHDNDLAIQAGQVDDPLVGELRSAADELSEAAAKYFSGKTISQRLTQKTNLLSVIPNDARTTYFDNLKNAIGHNFDNVYTTLNFDQKYQQCTLSDADIQEVRAYIKHHWCDACLRIMNTSGGLPLFTISPANNDPGQWEDYVKNLGYNAASGDLDAAGMGKGVGTPFADLGLQWSDAFLEFYDRNHWAAGKPGQILFSDQPRQTFYIEQSGETKSYVNEWAYQPLTYSMLKAMLLDL